MDAKNDWEAYVMGATAARDSVDVRDLEWDAAVLYAAGRIADLKAEVQALREENNYFREVLTPNRLSQVVIDHLDGECTFDEQGLRKAIARYDSTVYGEVKGE